MNSTAPAQHHPSCTPNDRDLVWHCNQCGLNESAADEERRANDSIEENVRQMNVIAELREQLAAEREKVDAIERTYREVRDELKSQLAAEREAGVKALAERSFELHTAVKALKGIRKHTYEGSRNVCLGCSFTFNTSAAALEKIGVKC